MCGVVRKQKLGQSALYVASAAGHVEAVRALLKAGADVGQADVGVVCSGWGVAGRDRGVRRAWSEGVTRRRCAVWGLASRGQRERSSPTVTMGMASMATMMCCSGRSGRVWEA